MDVVVNNLAKHLFRTRYYQSFTNPVFLAKLCVFLLVPLSFADSLKRGKLLSGLTYGGVAYHHILVGEKLKGSAADCYKLVRTGIRIANRHVKKTLRTTDRAECEAECSKITLFTCRAFNYRFRAYSSSRYMENCELSVQDTYGVDLDDRYNFYEDEDFDFYERINFGGSCDGSHDSSTGRENTWYGRGNNWYGRGDTWYGRGENMYGKGENMYGNTYASNYNNYYTNYGRGRDDEDSFELYKKNSRIDTRVVREKHRVKDLSECQQMCLRSRSFVCLTLSFSYDSSDYSSWFGKENCYLSDQKAGSLDRYGLLPDRGFDTYERDELDGGFGRDASDSGYYGSYGGEELYETVSGFQCYLSPCKEDRIGKYFYCETDSSGGWDYCCRPREYCQMSSGYPIKWCHVGSMGDDQWRPCNTASKSRAYLKKGEPDFKKLLESPSNSSTPSISSTTTTPSSSTTTIKSTPSLDEHIELADLPNLG